MKAKVVTIGTMMLLMSVLVFAGGSQEEAESASSEAELRYVEKHPEIVYGPAPGKTMNDYRFGFSFGGIADYANPVQI